ncbi:DNA-directed RNA polymerase I kDa polypeptide [Phlegmacium glaucopus]|nr:DNA-directed RNA polymerase I kDa polypeptide [Phlegmacium glaucopus]
MSSGTHKIGLLLFCPDCGSLLSLPRDGETIVTCEQCGHEEPASSYENVIITTRSGAEAFPSTLRQKRKTQTKHHEKGDQGTLVAEKCPTCGHMEAYSKEMQLRSADEGSTVFYTCVSCKHGWRVNN